MEHESTMKKEGTMKNALISVFDKTKVVELAEFLIARDWNIISSGGTYQYLKDNGIAVRKVEDVTGFAEMLDGRVKTLHPRIHGGLLALRDNEAHMAALKDNSIEAIDLVCVNLYPFAAKVAENLSFSELIEFIDIGGPSMLRSAAKNFKDVLVLSEVTQYQEFMAKYDTAALDMDYRKKLAGAVFTMTSRYDAQIAEYLQESVGVDGIGAPEDLGIDLASDKLILNLSKVKDLKYGENPHQKAAFYRVDGLEGFMTDFEQLNGKDMGYINYKDLESAWRIVCDFDEPACAAVKHNTPCGVALGESALEAYAKAYRCDPVSIFGGIVAVNREVDEACAAEMSKIMLHIVAAPGFTPEALAILKGKRNLIIIKMNQHPSGNKTMVSADGGVLIQDDDLELFDELQFVTEKVPDAAELEELKFALQVVKFVKSNGIVVSRDRMALGIGGGFVNRIDAAAYALNRGEKPLVMASDAFFPFDDVVALAGEKGIKAIIQPGGSLNDKLSIDRCNELGIAMVLTGIRHFRH